METNNVSVSINIQDKNKYYHTDIVFGPEAFKPYEGLPRLRQLMKAITDSFNTEIGMSIFDSTETPAENEVLTSYLEPEYSFVNYSLDPGQQLPYQKRLVKELGFDASWMAPEISKGRDSYRVFITGFRTLKFGQVEPLAFQGSFNTFDEVDEFYNQTVKGLLKLLDAN